MDWDDFYDGCIDWSISTIKNRISSLKNMGPRDEVVDLLIDLPTQELKKQLLKKAIKYNVKFTYEDFINLEFEFEDKETYKLLEEYTGFNRDNPYVDETNLCWDLVYDYYTDWDENTLVKRLHLIQDIPPIEELLEVLSWLSVDEHKDKIFYKFTSSTNTIIQWRDLYDYTLHMTENMLKYFIPSLTSLGPSHEIVEVIKDLPTDQLKELLINKAIQHNIIFTNDEYMILQEELSYSYFDKFSSIKHTPKYGNTITWDVFCEDYYEWDEQETLININKLINVGNSNEVVNAILDMPTRKCENELYRKALKLNISFTNDQLITLGKKTIVVNEEEDNADSTFKFNFLSILGLFSSFAKSNKTSRYCDGDCFHCPPHHGKRYGRWYYGHGHTEGCERCGNGGNRGMPFRD